MATPATRTPGVFGLTAAERGWVHSWDTSIGVDGPGSDAGHRRLTGRRLEPTLRFAKRLAERGNRVWVRYVLVPGYTDHPREVEGVARFASSLGNVERVDVLPFHKLGGPKYERLGV